MSLTSEWIAWKKAKKIHRCAELTITIKRQYRGVGIRGQLSSYLGEEYFQRHKRNAPSCLNYIPHQIYEHQHAWCLTIVFVVVIPPLNAFVFYSEIRRMTTHLSAVNYDCHRTRQAFQYTIPCKLIHLRAKN